MGDKRLRQAVIDELDFEPSVNSANIGVAVEKGVVTLTGHVGSYAEKLTAESTVKRVRGVHGIAQEIEVRYPADKKTADDQIARRAISIIAWNVQIPKDSVTVKVQNGWVTLTGVVDWQYQRVAAESAVRKLSGVIGVSNQITIKPSLQAIDVRKHILDALKRSADLEADAIRIEAHGDIVKLEGRLTTGYERDLVNRAAWSVPGVRMVEDRTTIA
jgi:osmotically-inducible protein OsmY